MAKQTDTRTHTLKRAVAGDGGALTRSVPLRDLTHKDRADAERHAPDNAGNQDDFLIHRMTGLALDAVIKLAYADSADLVAEIAEMSGLTEEPELLPDTVPPGYEYPLTKSIKTPNGTQKSLKFKELTRGDQKAAGQFSALETEKEGFLIGRMAGLPLEDVDLLHIRDSFALKRFFRRVVDTGGADAQAGSGADAAAQAGAGGAAADAAQ